MSAFLRAKLSTIVTSWPRCERCKEVGHPQKPSPPRIKMRTRTSDASQLLNIARSCPRRSIVAAGGDRPAELLAPRGTSQAVLERAAVRKGGQQLRLGPRASPDLRRQSLYGS